MSRFFTADWHFNHRNIIRYCSRPFLSVEEMNETIICNWNKVVRSDKDTVYVLGDVGWPKSGLPEILKKLNGRKILVIGNHDEQAVRKHFKDGWYDVYQFLRVKIGSHQVYLSHFPYHYSFWKHLWFSLRHFIIPNVKTYSRYCFKEAWKRLRDDGNWLIHGHVHDRWKVQGKQINVGVDVWDFTPVREGQIIKILDGKV